MGSDNGALEKAKAVLKKKDEKIKQQDEQIKQLTDQLAWYRHKFGKPPSEKYIPKDPNQRSIDFEGLEVFPEEEETRIRLALLSKTKLREHSLYCQL